MITPGHSDYENVFLRRGRGTASAARYRRRAASSRPSSGASARLGRRTRAAGRLPAARRATPGLSLCAWGCSRRLRLRYADPADCRYRQNQNRRENRL